MYVYMFLCVYVYVDVYTCECACLLGLEMKSGVFLNNPLIFFETGSLMEWRTHHIG